MESGPPKRPDSLREPPHRLYGAKICRKNRAFLTRPARNATYSVAMNEAYQDSHNCAGRSFVRALPVFVPAHRQFATTAHLAGRGGCAQQ
jgi:hypothetical protein